MSEKVFDVDQVIAGNIPPGDDRCRFDATVLENIIKRLIEQKLGDANTSMADTGSSDSKPCPTLSSLQVRRMPKVLQFYSAHMAAKDSIRINVQFGRQLFVQVQIKEIDLEIGDPGTLRNLKRKREISFSFTYFCTSSHFT